MVCTGARQRTHRLTRLARALCPPYTLLLEIRRDLLLFQIGGEVLLDWDVDECRPDRRVGRIGIEMLMLDAGRFHREQDEIAFFPVLPLAVHDRIALALDHVDHEAALVAM